MRYLLIPVKDLREAKQRLANLLTQEERTRLATLLMERTLKAAAGVRNVDRIAVVTLYDPAIKLAQALGFEVIRESRQISESDSVDFGSREAMRRGARQVLRIPIDLPWVSGEEIDQILAEGGNAPVLLVPSRDGTGTNAILRRPPDLFPSRFGPGSLARHLGEARAVGADCRILDRPRLAFDIDDPEDVDHLLQSEEPSPVAELLRSILKRR